MEKIFQILPELAAEMITAVLTSLVHNWLPLSLAILTAAIMKVHIDTEKLKSTLLAKPKVSILSSVAVGAFTPLCACGTMAVVIGLLTTALPWGPIMAFLTSSPLMSPDGFILLAGVVGFRFAAALAAASIFIGLGSGFITHVIEKKTTFLANQTRLQGRPKAQTCGCSGSAAAAVQACGCSETEPAAIQACGCSGSAAAAVQACSCSELEPVTVQECCPEAASVYAQGCCSAKGEASAFAKVIRKARLPEIAKAVWSVGVKQILLFFSIFAAVGYLINYFVPTSIIMALFRPDSVLSVPLAALIGLPLYVTGESAIPLIQSLIAGGAGEGSMMAFMITGPATSAWVIAGITAFMKKKAIGLYVLYILAGGIIAGYLYDLIVALGL
jgi:uncharacterized membrane protein YraQ (UPF0718 family)